ncbi:HtaA domain-containing protein [Streptomyces sp. NPDC088387]|uniref:HtaA domain-containing protein n=1 Tax=Streptomyces sp. NPDC088387 TaxID=3365859 RepID=UPI00381278C3
MTARKRPAAALVVAGGAVLALLAPGAATARAGEVSGGYVGWATGALAGSGLTLEGDSGSAGRAWFRAESGAVDAGTGDADVRLAGAARLATTGEPADQLLLDELRLGLDEGTGALYVRQPGAGKAEFAFAEVTSGTAEAVVRDTGATWTGLRASLTEEGARLLSDWSGREFTEGEALGVLDLTVGTGAGTPVPPERNPAPRPSTSKPPSDAPESEPVSTPDTTGPTATVASPALTAGGEQTVTGEGFTPGETVLVAIDGDTRYQAVADEQGRVARAFPVYANAPAGEHTAELSTVTGEHGGAAVRFEVRSPD